MISSKVMLTWPHYLSLYVAGVGDACCCGCAAGEACGASCCIPPAFPVPSFMLPQLVSTHTQRTAAATRRHRRLRMVIATCSHTIRLQRFPSRPLARCTRARALTDMALGPGVDLPCEVAAIAATRDAEACPAACTAHTRVGLATCVRRHIDHPCHTCLVILGLWKHAAGSVALSTHA